MFSLARGDVHAARHLWFASGGGDSVKTFPRPPGAENDLAVRPPGGAAITALVHVGERQDGAASQGHCLQLVVRGEADTCSIRREEGYLGSLRAGNRFRLELIKRA